MYFFFNTNTILLPRISPLQIHTVGPVYENHEESAPILAKAYKVRRTIESLRVVRFLRSEGLVLCSMSKLDTGGLHHMLLLCS